MPNSHRYKQNAIKIAIVLAGSILAAFGIDLAIHAGFGGATLAILWQGLAIQLHISIGMANFLSAFVMLLFCYFYDREQVYYGTVLYMVVYSAFTDIFRPLLHYAESWIVNGFLMLLGVLLFSAGTGIYAYANYGRGAYDALCFAIHKHHGWQIKYIRIVLDIVWVVLGVLLGGKAGLCTLATIAFSGMIIQATVRLLQTRFGVIPPH